MHEREIFIEALSREDPTERAAYLKQACQADEVLLHNVEQLLAEHGRVDKFLLDCPPVDFQALSQRPLWEQPGESIGPYQLLERIGEGGMGIVFKAQQTQPIERLVALKIIKPGMDTRQVIARFDAERQSISRMDHPNIARWLDAGATERGRPYFVMELVRGVPITMYCDQQCLAIRQRLELFIQVCHAVQHAHQRGVIHRDLKPTNVLVSDEEQRAVPKIIDFGVATSLERVTERTPFTHAGQLIGTVEYMSPEQATFNPSDVDTRSDVYSLGVILYELLTGSTPFSTDAVPATAIDELLRVVREEDPTKPSIRAAKLHQLAAIADSRSAERVRWSGMLRGELDWIVMKTLEKDRHRRYDSAQSLASDVARYLANQSVEACPPSAVYRIKKAVSRNKLLISAASMVICVLVAATAVSLWQARRAREAERRAEARLVSERAALGIAQEEAAKASEIRQMLEQMLASASPTAGKPMSYTVRQMLDDFSKQLDHPLQDHPETEAAIRATIGNTYRRLQAFDRAEPHLQKALELRTRKHGSLHPDVAQSLIDESANLFGRGDIRAAKVRAKQALAIHRRSQLPDAVVMQILTALQLYAIEQLQFEDATRLAQEARTIASKQPGKFAEEANMLHHLADARRHQGDALGAEPVARQSVALHQKLHGPHHPETAHGMFVLANVLHDQQRYAEARQWFQATLDIQRKHFNDEQTPVITALAGLARTLRANGDQTVLDELARTVGLSDSYPDEWQSAYFRGNYFAELGDWQKADQAFVVAAENEANPQVFRSIYFSALLRVALRDQAKYRDACAKLMLQADDSRDTPPSYTIVWACTLAPQATDNPGLVVSLAQCIVQQARHSVSLSTYGGALFRAGQLAEARQQFIEALAKMPPSIDDLRVPTYCQLFLALIDHRLGEPQSARSWLQQAVHTLDHPPKAGQRHLAASWENILPLQLLRTEVTRTLDASPTNTHP